MDTKTADLLSLRYRTALKFEHRKDKHELLKSKFFVKIISLCRQIRIILQLNQQLNVYKNEEDSTNVFNFVNFSNKI